MIKLIDIKIENDVNKFPYLKEFVAKFNPDIPNVIFVHKDTLYTRYTKLPLHILNHELTHMRQQEQVGIENWFKTYLTDDKKRLEWEIEAYKAERDCMRPGDWRHRLAQVLPFLCGPMYGNMVTKEEALKLFI